MLGRRRTTTFEHDDVLKAATAILEQDGPLAVTAERLGAALGAPADQTAKAVDVDAVVAEAYRVLSVAEQAVVKRTILANPSPAQQMRALLDWLSTPPEDSDAIRLETWALARRNPALRAALHDGESAWHGLVASVVRRGARSGDFPQADAEEIAAHIISLVDGINAYELIGYRSDLDRRRLLRRVVEAELGLVWGEELVTALE